MSDVTPIYIFTPLQNVRVDYACELIFSVVLGLPYKCVSDLPEDNVALVQYVSYPVERGVTVPNSGLLFSQTLDILPAEDVPFQEPISATDPPATIHVDIFASAFYVATEYEKYIDPHVDSHERYDLTVYEKDNPDKHQYPLIHQYAEWLWEHLIAQYPNLQRPKRFYDFHLTFDIDHPWKHRYKKWYIQAGGILKSLFSASMEELKERGKSLWRNDDPYDTFKHIFSLSPPAKTLFFFLIERKSKHDTRHTYLNNPYRRLIRSIHAKGYPIGIHPSYTSFLDLSQIQHERRQLEQIIGQPIIHSRQHYLKYRLPDTFRYLCEAGIRHDYTLCVNHSLGFRTGMALPYPWFDLEKNVRTDLWLHPTMVMDTSLRQYLQLTPEDAVQAVDHLVNQTRQVNGCFTLLIHNDALSDSGPWKGWRDSIIEIINLVKGHGESNTRT